jgi:hypothetical protein
MRVPATAGKLRSECPAGNSRGRAGGFTLLSGFLSANVTDFHAFLDFQNEKSRENAAFSAVFGMRTEKVHSCTNELQVRL